MSGAPIAGRLATGIAQYRIITARALYSAAVRTVPADHIPFLPLRRSDSYQLEPAQAISIRIRKTQLD